MTRRAVLGLLIVLGLLAGAVVWGRDRAATQRADRRLAGLRLQAALAACPAGLGPALPALSLPCLGGGRDVRVQQSVGRPAVVNLWAWWCLPCQRETPLLVGLAGRAGDRLAVVGVASDPDQRLALEFAKDFGVHYPVVLDATRALDRRYGGGLPVTLFLDAGGAVRGVQRGGITDRSQLDALVAELLGVRL